MKATLEFQIGPGEPDNEAHHMAVHAGEMYSALFAIREEIRRQGKYENPTKAQREALARIQEHIPHDVLDLMG